MIAAGMAVPRIDRAAQWPEGVDPRSEFTMGMEDAWGLSYRALRPILGPAPFQVWLVAAVSLWSCLSIGAAYVAGRALWGDSTAGLVSAAAYGLSPAATFRTVGNFLREDFALPFLFGSFALLARALEGGRFREPRERGLSPPSAAASAAAIALSAGAATWHLSRFYIALFAAAVGLAAVLAAASAPRDRGAAGAEQELAAAAVALAPAVVALTLAGLLVPVLRAKGFLLSPAFLSCAAVTGALGLAARRAPGTRSPAAVALAALAAGLALAAALPRFLPGAEKEYAHVTSLLVEKLRFLGRKPADPALLSDDARVFWVGPFDTPAAGVILLTYSTMLLWGPAAVVVAARRALRALTGRGPGDGRRGQTALVATLLLALAFGVAALLVERMVVFLVFFAALLAPGIIHAAGQRRRGVALAALAALGVYEIAYLRAFGDENPWRRLVQAVAPVPPAEAVPNAGNNARVVAWIRRHLPADAVLLTWFPAGPMVLTDTGRSINLHSMFESHALRAKERRFREALYASEEDLHALCREWESDYLLYQANLLLDTTPESYRYMAGRTRVRSDCAAALLHFRPERLTRFRLVYQDSYYRVFRVLGGAEASPAADSVASAIPYEEIFDPEPLGEMGEWYPDERTPRVLSLARERLAETERGIAAEASGRPREAEAIYRAVLARSPDAPEARIRLALLVLGEGRVAEAEGIVARALAARPDYAELHFARGLVLERAGRRAEAAAAYREAVAIAPGAEPARARLRALTGSEEVGGVLP